MTPSKRLSVVWAALLLRQFRNMLLYPYKGSSCVPVDPEPCRRSGKTVS